MVASVLIIEARAKVRALIDRETKRTGSRMAGYHVVASMIGRTPEWLRAFANNYDHVSLDPTILHIGNAYRRITGKADVIDATARDERDSVAPAVRTQGAHSANGAGSAEGSRRSDDSGSPETGTGA